VLEIGCGTGTFTNQFIKEGAQSFTGIDLSPKMIEMATKKALLQNYKAPVHFYVDSLENFALHNQNKYDIIQSSSFIHHLSDIETGIKAIKSMLKPNGVYIAIHEEINNRDKIRIERIDDQLQYLLGYAGARIVNKNVRIKDTIKRFFITPIKYRIGKLLGFNKLIESSSVQAPLPTQELNYVDFQLNEPFSLTKKCSVYGKVKPYCYLAFTELMIFGKPHNHEMLIMHKE